MAYTKDAPSPRNSESAFSVINIFNEVSNLLGTSGAAKRTTGNTESEPLGCSPGDPSKLLTSLNTFATGKNRDRDSPVVTSLGACLRTTKLAR